MVCFRLSPLAFSLHFGLRHAWHQHTGRYHRVCGGRGVLFRHRCGRVGPCGASRRVVVFISIGFVAPCSCSLLFSAWLSLSWPLCISGSFGLHAYSWSTWCQGGGFRGVAAVRRKAWSLSVGSLYFVVVGMLIITSAVYYLDVLL